MPEPEPPGEGGGQVVAERSAQRAAQADQRVAAGWESGRAVVIPMSRLTNASTPMANRTTATSPTSATDGQSYWPASGRWLVVHPNHVRFASGASSGMAAW